MYYVEDRGADMCDMICWIGIVAGTWGSVFSKVLLFVHQAACDEQLS